MNSNVFRLFSIPITTLSVSAVHTILQGWLRKEDRCRFIFTPNPEILLRSKKDASYRKVLRNGDILIPDGSGILLASKLLRGGVQQRITGVDITEYLLGYAAKNRLTVSVVLKEGGLTQARRVKDYFAKNFPLLVNYVITSNTSYRKSGHIIEDITTSSPDIVFVTFGAPEQERWMYNNKNRLPGVRIMCGVGGAFDMLTGTVRRAPRLVRDIHLEWLWRLIQHPKRIVRIFNATVVFPFFVIIDVYRSRFYFRRNVLAFIFKDKDTILIIRKKYVDIQYSFWALPQGGVGTYETEEEAALREVKEEVGLQKSLRIVGHASYIHRYRWPWYHRNIFGHRFAGQRQKSYFIRAIGNEEVRLDSDDGESITEYRWVTQKELVRMIEEKRKKNLLILLKEFNSKFIYERETP